MKSPLLLFLLALFVQSSYAEPLSLNPLFSDDAVIQQEMSVPVWGKGEAGKTVTVHFGEQECETLVDENNRWQAILEPVSMSAVPRDMRVSSSDEELLVRGILVGEVWVGSGQSNMGFSVKNSFDAEAAAKGAEAGEYAKVRLFKVPVNGADDRQERVNAAWAKPTAETVSSFSATAFFFAAKLSRDRSVPVGIIQSAMGGTNAFSWINNETFEDEPVAETIRAYWEETVERHPEAIEEFKKASAEWKVKADEIVAGGGVAPRAPREPLGPEHFKRPTGLYNAMVAPLQPYAIRGVIWYQGEGNSRLPFYPGYKDLMLALAEDWRSDWANAAGSDITRVDFPFYLVQLPNFGGGDPEGWPRIREQMLKFWQEGTRTGMVVAIDKGEADDIHPRDKKPVGERLAVFARANAYGEDLAFSGPIFDSLQIEGNRALVGFQHAGSGLKSLDEEPLKYFEIAAADGEFKPAVAKIVGDSLEVSSSEVSEPRAVRYAWLANPEGANLGNEEGLPASPFRSDSW